MKSRVARWGKLPTAHPLHRLFPYLPTNSVGRYGAPTFRYSEAVISTHFPFTPFGSTIIPNQTSLKKERHAQSSFLRRLSSLAWPRRRRRVAGNAHLERRSLEDPLCERFRRPAAARLDVVALPETFFQG